MGLARVRSQRRRGVNHHIAARDHVREVARFREIDPHAFDLDFWRGVVDQSAKRKARVAEGREQVPAHEARCAGDQCALFVHGMMVSQRSSA
jgi:hypothetical protein